MTHECPLSSFFNKSQTPNIGSFKLTIFWEGLFVCVCVCVCGKDDGFDLHFEIKGG